MNSYELAQVMGWTLLWEPPRQTSSALDDSIRHEQVYAQVRAKSVGVDFGVVSRTIDVRDWSDGAVGVRVAWWIRR